MGVPIPDDGTGGDDAIDIYLVQPGQRARNSTIPTDALAAAWPTDPRLGRRSSGYILTPRAGVGTDVWKQILIHELFHIFQFRYNAEVSHRNVAGAWTGWWFTEAPATWAETYFGRPRSRVTHGWRFGPFQGTASTTSLHVSTPTLHKYNAYVWPLFMQQEKGADVIHQAWIRLESVGPGAFEQADEVLDSLVLFRTKFRDFAVRMLDKQLPGDPIAPRLQVVDPNTPLEVPPVVQDRSSLPPVKIEELGHTITERLPALTATYIRLDPHGDARQVTLDFRKPLVAGGRVDVPLWEFSGLSSLLSLGTS